MEKRMRSDDIIIASGHFLREEEYWLDQLKGELVRTTFPYDSKKTLENREDPVGKQQRETVTFKLEEKLCTRLIELSNKSDSRLFMILTAGLMVLLEKYSGRRDIIVGTTIEKQEIEAEFVNTILPLRTQIKENITFKDLLIQVRQTVIDANENQNYPLESLLYHLNMPPRETKDFPLFDIAVLLENIHAGKYIQHINLDMIFYFKRTNKNVAGVLAYNSLLYQKRTIERIINHFKHLLHQVLVNVESALSRLEILSGEEKKQLVIDFNDNHAEFSRDKTIFQFIEKHAEIEPERAAVDFTGHQITYGHLNERVNQLARFLHGNGTQGSQPVGIMLTRSLRMVESILAVWKAGCSYIPIDPLYPTGRVKYVLDDSQISILLTDSQAVKKQSRNVVLLDELENVLSGRPGENLKPVDNMADVAYIIYTSGTTGKPKGVMVEHTGMMNHIQAKINDLKITKNSIIAQNSPHTFDISVWQFFSALITAGKTVIYPNELILEIEQFLSRLIKDQVTLLEVVPSYLSVMLNALGTPPPVISSLEYLLVTGDEVKSSLVRKWFETYPGIKIVNAYGPTEASDDITHHIMAKAPDSDLIPIGKPIQNLNIYIVDKNMNLCPYGVTGEICVSGVGVGRGYLNNPELTNSKFKIPNKKTPHQLPHASMHSPSLHHPIYQTGDLGYWHPDGTIEFLGRKDNQVKIRGNRIELAEIENKLLEHPCIKEAVVLVKEESHHSKYLCAYLVQDGKPGKLEIKDYLLKRLPDYMVPTQFIYLEQMPLTHNGKIDRKALARINASDAFLPYITGEMLEPLAPGINLHPIVKKVPVNSNHMSCFIIGETTLPIKCAEMILNRGHHILGMISNDPKVLDWAKQHDIARVKSKKAGIIPFLKQHPFDYLFSINNLLILSEEILELAGKCVFNYHNGPLPAYAGSYAPYWALMNMEKTHGITWHLAAKDIDTGDIVKQVQIAVDPRDTGASLNMKCFDAGVKAFEQLLDHLEKGTVTKQKQQLSKRTYFEKYKRPGAACFISFDWEAEKIDAFIRALNFGAYENPLGLPKIAVENNFFILSEISLLNRKSQEVPGTVVKSNEESIVVATATRDIQIKKIRDMAGKEIPISKIIKTFNLHAGGRLNEIVPGISAFIREYHSLICKHELFWVNRLSGIRPLKLINPDSNIAPVSTSPAASISLHRLKASKPFPHDWEFLIAAFASYLSCLTGIFSFHIGYTDVSHLTNVKELEGLFANQVPLRVELDANQTFAAFFGIISKELERLRKRQTYIRDIYARYPSLSSRVEQRMPIGITCVNNLDEFEAPQTGQLHLVIPRFEKEWMVLFDPNVMNDEIMGKFVQLFSLFLNDMETNPGSAIGTFAPVSIEVKGRTQELIEIDEAIIDIGEIENCLWENHDIDEAAAVIKTDKTNKKYLCAYVTSGKSLMESKLRKYLSEKLAPHMIPRYLIQLEKIPLTPGGKPDRKLLQTLDIKIKVGEDPDVLKNEMEKKLADVWQEVLGIKKIGINDNFFVMGGDSIKAIQIASRLQKSGLKIDTRDLFINPTIKTLAANVKEVDKTAEQGIISGKVHLTPIQKWFFQENFTNPHHFNHSVMLYSENGFAQEAIKAVFNKIIRHHDALRMVYITEGNQILQINHGTNGNMFDLEILDLHHENKENIERKIQTVCSRIQSGIQLSSGPLVKLGLFKTNQGDHLLIVVHHLVIDGVSWRILFEDFAIGYRQFQQGEEIKFLLKTHSFKYWAEKLTGYAQSREILRELDYWKKIEESKIENLPKDYEIGKEYKKYKYFETATLELDKDETEKLLREVNHTYNTDINDILLTALGLTVQEWAGIEKVLVNLEGHGREPIIEDIDISRTVGWFTSQFPVLLDVSAAPKNNEEEKLSHCIKFVKETLKQIPDNGLGYSILKHITSVEKRESVNFQLEPEINFNYLGEFGQESNTNHGLIRMSPMSNIKGDSISPEAENNITINISGLIVDRRLSLSVSYNKYEYRQTTIQRLVDYFRSNLVKIINHCIRQENKVLTPSDFTMKDLGIKELETVFDMVRDI